MKVAAVGERPRRALLDFGIKPDLVPEGEHSGEGLAAAWQPYDSALDPINRVLLPRADIATETLVARLNELGWEYRGRHRVPDGARGAAARPDPRGDQGWWVRCRAVHLVLDVVRNLIGIAWKPHAVTVIAVIGPQTAKTAAEFGLRVDVKAPRPSATGLVRRAGRVRRRGARGGHRGSEPVRKPSERRRGARRRLR